MQHSQTRSEKFERLRRQAERLLRQLPESENGVPTDMLELIHELRIHQAELEIQNEELQRAQHEISELQQEYETLYEFAPCGYLTLNNKGLITHINLTGVRLLDANRNDVLRAGLSKFIDSGWQDAFHSARARSSQTGQKQNIELPIKRNNHPPLWVRLDIEADRDGADAATQWRVVLFDISEKKKAIQALEKSEVRYRKMMESISDPLYVCSPDLTIKFMNPAMVDRLGRNAIGETCHTAMHGLSQTCEWCPFDKVKNGATIEKNILSPLDDRHYRVTHMLVANDDRTVSKLAIYRDIENYLMAVKEKEKARTKLHQARKMESIGRLAGGIAHDFNNLLYVIIGFTELALEDVENGAPLEDNLHEIYSASIKAKDLVTQILAFARKTNEEVKSVDIGKIVKESIKLIRSTLPANIEIKPKITSDALVVGNPSLLRQILLNLASNAADAMEDNGGLLKIDFCDTVVDQQFAMDNDLLLAGHYVQLTVSDTGPGIPSESIKNIFDPYFTTKGLGKGTGLGLASTYGTVRKYGGAIHVESRPGRGAVFKILLPSVRQHKSDEPCQPEAMPQGSERILFVDDEPLIVKMGAMILERLGYTVTALSDSSEALERFRSRPDDFDLVITDMAMPNLTGEKLAVELMQIRPDIPIILCTGYSKKISDETASEIAIRAFAYKPMVMADLAKTVRKVLDEAKG